MQTVRRNQPYNNMGRIPNRSSSYNYKDLKSDPVWCVGGRGKKWLAEIYSAKGSMVPDKFGDVLPIFSFLIQVY